MTSRHPHQPARDLTPSPGAIGIMVRDAGLAISAGRWIFGLDVRLVLVAVSIAFVGAGLAWPQAADALLRLLIVTLGVLFAAGGAYRALRPAASTETVYSPFHLSDVDRPQPVVPRRLRDLTAELKTADDPTSAARTAIPIPMLLIIREESEWRLVDRHRLRLRDPSDHARIQGLVTEPTWRIIRPPAAEPRSSTRPSGQHTTVPLSQLGIILDDLERL